MTDRVNASRTTSNFSSPVRIRPRSYWDQSQSGSSSPQSSWRSSSSLQTRLSASAQDINTRQWSYTGFEWTVSNVEKLKNFIEESQDPDVNTPGQFEDFEVLKESPNLGEKFKLEVARSHSPNPQRLSLFITSLVMMDYPDYESSVSVMAAIRCQENRGAQAEWLWEHFQERFVFQHDSEVWVCPLPLLSELLENARIRETDSFVICIQIQTPEGSSIPQQTPSASFIPRSIIRGLEASLDNPNTGDVQFICLERQEDERLETPATPRLPSSPRSASSASTHSPFTSATIARKRIIYAHSDILMHRSEYFSTLLNSNFSESLVSTPGDRKRFSIVVEESDFVTVYWLLKYCYANWLLFRPLDDPRAAIDGIGTGWSARWLRNGERSGEWDWKTLQKTGDSVESLHSASTSSNSKDAQTISSASRSTRSADASTNAKMTTSPLSSLRSANPAAPLNARRATNTVPTSSTLPAVSRVKPIVVPVSTAQSMRSPMRSPHGQRQPDPHAHPTPQPQPASALSMYQVAHRYALPELEKLCLEQIMATITPANSFALLLASASWEELRSLAEDFVVDNWDEVSVSEEFSQCCEEISEGAWGSDGGKTIMAVFRRLKSPPSRQ